MNEKQLLDILAKEDGFKDWEEAKKQEVLFDDGVFENMIKISERLAKISVAQHKKEIIKELKKLRVE